MPPGYLDRPDLDPALDFVWDAFWILSSDRAYGIGEGPIPFASIDRFARRYGLDDLASFDEFTALLRGLDGTYLKVRSEQAERDREAGKANKPV